MRRNCLWGVFAVMVFGIQIGSPAHASICVNDHCADVKSEAGLGTTPQKMQPGPVPMLQGTPGTLWDNGASDGVTGLTSERNTIISGTGGPEGDHAGTSADDFELAAASELTEIRVCLYHDGTTAEMYIFPDAGGSPGAAPVWGGPTTTSIVSTTFNDNTARCAAVVDAYPGREYVFSVATTGVAITLPPGRYWLAVVGEGGSRAFWATSGNNAPNPLQPPQYGSTYFAVPYWSDASSHVGEDPAAFAFDIDGHPLAVQVPTMTPTGMGMFAVMLALAGLLVARRKSIRS